MKFSSAKFNLIDRTIYRLEEVLQKIVLFFHDEKTPDPEEIILAATKHLQEENELLKEFRIPEQLEFDQKNSTYSCPKCKVTLEHELVENYKIKYCSECGKRLFRVDHPML